MIWRLLGPGCYIDCSALDEVIMFHSIKCIEPREETILGRKEG